MPRFKVQATINACSPARVSFPGRNFSQQIFFQKKRKEKCNSSPLILREMLEKVWRDRTWWCCRCSRNASKEKKRKKHQRRRRQQQAMSFPTWESSILLSVVFFVVFLFFYFLPSSIIHAATHFIIRQCVVQQSGGKKFTTSLQLRSWAVSKLFILFILFILKICEGGRWVGWRSSISFFFSFPGYFQYIKN